MDKLLIGLMILILFMVGWLIHNQDQNITITHTTEKTPIECPTFQLPQFSELPAKPVLDEDLTSFDTAVILMIHINKLESLLKERQRFTEEYILLFKQYDDVCRQEQ